MELYTAPPPGSTVICADELGPVIPRTFPPDPGWSPDGHRVKAPLEYSRGPEKTWVYGGLRVADGQAVTLCAPSRNSAFYQDFLQLEEQADPEGTIWVITDNPLPHITLSVTALKSAYPKMASMAAHLATELRELQTLSGLEWQLLQSQMRFLVQPDCVRWVIAQKAVPPGQIIAGRLHAAPLA